MSEEHVKRWNYLYKEKLPELAKARDSCQKKWPVYLDHCFARIVLDNAVGREEPWTARIKPPAVKNMTDDQFEKAIDLAEKIVAGTVDINELNENSLKLRGKKGRSKDHQQETDAKSSPAKRARREDENISRFFVKKAGPTEVDPARKKVKTESNLKSEDERPNSPNVDIVSDFDLDVQLKRIAASNLTSFRKEALSLLCQVPAGRYSTYQAMSDFISDTSHKTCARAVGSAMRNNPFAPEVPCHRILASDGTLGGFGGHWGEEGKFANKKHELLYKEGVRFDSNGKVKGPVFRGFKESKLVS